MIFGKSKAIKDLELKLNNANTMLEIQAELIKRQENQIYQLSDLLNVALSRGKFGKGIAQGIQKSFNEVFDPEKWDED